MAGNWLSRAVLWIPAYVVSFLSIIATFHTAFRRSIASRQYRPRLPPPPPLRSQPIVSDSRDDQQIDCPLFARLPSEIRLLIWQNYFRHDRVHIWDDSGPGAMVCMKDDAEDYPQSNHARCYRVEKRIDCVPLLMTCRRIYFEAATLLYQKTFFSFTIFPEALTHFRRRVPYDMFACIRKVNVTIVWCAADFRDICALSQDPDSLDANKRATITQLWDQLWLDLAAMDDLRWLRFQVLFESPQMSSDELRPDQEGIMQCVKQVTQPAHFELVLPIRVRDCLAKGLPCKVTYRKQTQTGLLS